MLAVLTITLLISHAAAVAHGVNPGVIDHHKQPLIPALSLCVILSAADNLLKEAGHVSIHVMPHAGNNSAMTTQPVCDMLRLQETGWQWQCLQVHRQPASSWLLQT